MASNMITRTALLAATCVVAFAAMWCPMKAAAEEADTTALSGNWVHQVIESGFHINDPRINYPRFPRFALKVYNLGDRLFNHYDSTYVVGTGKNWKAQMKNDMWMRTYMMQLADNSTIHITSRLYDDLGFHLSFMAVSIGYTFKVNSFMGDDTKRNRFDFNFTCSRFAVNYWTQSVDGGAVIRKFGDYRDGKHLNVKYNDIYVDDSHLDLYYFFNNQKYSQAATYCFSKYQLKSAGSWILGASYDRHNMELDFSSLPPEMLEALPSLQRNYHVQYSDYCIIGGYAYNKVLVPRRWTLNLTVLPFFGYKHSATNDYAERDIKDMISTNLNMSGAIVYNHKAIFMALTGRFCGFVNFSNGYNFFYSTQTATLTAGIRF